MSSVWTYIQHLLGEGFQWGKSQKELKAAILRAEADDNKEAVEHLKIILDRRNFVNFETPEK